MTAPFEDREGWEMTAIPLDGSIYIELRDPPEVREKRYLRWHAHDRCRKRLMGDSRWKKQSSWAWQTYMGYGFESFSTYPPVGGDPPEGAPKGWSGDVNQNVQVSSASVPVTW